MSKDILDDVRRVLAVFEHLQQEFGQLFVAKSRALRELRVAELEVLGQAEQVSTQRLQSAVTLRQQLLERVRASGGGSYSSLRQLVSGLPDLPGEDRRTLLRRIGLAEQASSRLRQESWTHWIIANRCFHHYSELLDLIAHGGFRAPTYQVGTDSQLATGSRGAMLDASV